MACLDYRASKDFPEAVNAQPLSNHMATTWLSCSTCYYENITTMPFRWVKHTPTDTWKSQRPSRLCSHTTALFPLRRRSTKRARPQSVLLHQEQQPHGGCGMVRCNGVDCSPGPARVGRVGRRAGVAAPLGAGPQGQGWGTVS